MWGNGSKQGQTEVNINLQALNSTFWILPVQRDKSIASNLCFKCDTEHAKIHPDATKHNNNKGQKHDEPGKHSTPKHVKFSEASREISSFPSIIWTETMATNTQELFKSFQSWYPVPERLMLHNSEPIDTETSPRQNVCQQFLVAYEFLIMSITKIEIEWIFSFLRRWSRNKPDHLWDNRTNFYFDLNGYDSKTKLLLNTSYLDTCFYPLYSVKLCMTTAIGYVQRGGELWLRGKW